MMFGLQSQANLDALMAAAKEKRHTQRILLAFANNAEAYQGTIEAGRDAENATIARKARLESKLRAEVFEREYGLGFRVLPGRILQDTRCKQTGVQEMQMHGGRLEDASFSSGIAWFLIWNRMARNRGSRFGALLKSRTP